MSINYQEIVENLRTDDIIRLMSGLGADRYRELDNYVIFPTICHNEDASQASMKLYYYKDSHFFYCYTECGSLSPFKFLQHYYETRNIQYDWYTDVLQVLLNCSTPVLNSTTSVQYKSIRSDYEQQKNRKDLPHYSEGILDVFVKKYPIEWLEDHISAAAMDKFNIKYSISQNKIIIPHYDVNGRLVGIRGRALDPKEVETVGKYMPVQIEGKWYSHPLSLNLYGLDKNWKNIKKYRVAFVYEAEKSVLQAEQFCLPTCNIAVCGSNLNKFQVDLLMRYCAPQEIIICFDREEKSGEDKYFQKLWKMCMKYSSYCNMSFVYDREGITELKDSPTDRGEKTFTKLLEERVRVK